MSSRIIDLSLNNQFVSIWLETLHCCRRKFECGINVHETLWKNGLQYDFYIWDTNHEYSTTLIMQCIYDSEVVGNKFEINGIRWLKKNQRNLVPHFFGKQTAAFIIS